MFRKSFRNATLGVVLVVVAIAQTRDAQSQTQYAEICRKQCKQAASGSPEQLLAMFKLTDALESQNLTAALRNAESAVELAKQTDDPDFAKIARLDFELIKRRVQVDSNAKSKSDALNLTAFSLTAESLPELRFHLYSALIEDCLLARTPTDELRPLLESFEAAAFDCTDLHLNLKQKALDVYVRVFQLDESPRDPRIRKKLNAMRIESENMPYLEGSVVTHLVNGQAAAKEKRNNDALTEFRKALSAAEESKNQCFIYRCHRNLAIFMLRNRDFESSSAHLEASLRKAKKLESQPLILETMVTLIAIERKLGNFDQAAAYARQAQNSPTLNQIPVLQQNAVYHQAMWAQSRIQNDSERNAYREKIIPTAAVAKIKSQNNELNSQASALNSLEQRIDQVSRIAASNNQSQLQAIAKAEDSVRFLKKYSMISTLAVFLLFPWFILLVVRNRLKKVSVELDSERIASQQNQIKCNDLAARLSRMQRMESLGLMAGSVAHDFNNILVGVMGNAEVIQMKNKSGDGSPAHDEFVKQRISNIIKSAEKAASLSRQMLAYAGKQLIAKRATNLNELILQYETILRSSCRKNQELVLELSSEKIVSKVDITQIEQVLLNLVTNAVEASNNDCKITIRTGEQTIDDVENDFTLFGLRKTGGEFCFIEVIDSGKGISSEELERIFEPFYSNSEFGRGLGLSVVYGVVEGHDGFIKCESTIGSGTNFRILLPRSNAPVENLEPDDQNHPQAEFFDHSPAHLNQTILVIDDEEAVLELCSQLIQLNGWNAVTALGGDAGLRMAEEHADEISCILVDVVMPEMGANELLRELELREIRVPVVLMSGFSQTKLEFFLDRPNVISIVQKPFHANEIQAALEQAISFQNRENFSVSNSVIAKSSERPK